MPTFIEVAQTAVEISQFWIFQNGGCRYLGFQNFKFLTVGHANEVEPLHCAKFRLNRSNPGRHGDFLLFKVAAAAVFDFWNFRFLTIGMAKKVELHQYAKFRQNCSRRDRDIEVLILCQFGLKMPIHALFGFFGSIFPPNNVTHRPNPQKDHPWAERRHLSHKPRKSVARFELDVWTRKKDRTGQDRRGQEKRVIFHLFAQKPQWSDVHENLCSGWCSRRNRVCQVSKWNFQGLRFYKGSNFPFFLLILNGPYNSAPLLRCLWLKCFG